MRYELSIALRYLIPRRRQLSVAIISLLSVGVIALVVWLILLFLSITEGIEKNWVDKLIVFNGPIQATPTEDYYRSYFYQVDSLSNQSNYRYKSLEEKLGAAQSDPYDASVDAEIPSYWPEPLRRPDGSLIDPVKGLLKVVNSLREPGGRLRASSYELGLTQMRLSLNRSFSGQNTLNSQGSFFAVSTFDAEGKRFASQLLPQGADDVSNLLYQISLFDTSALSAEQGLFKKIFSYLDVEALKTGKGGWLAPRALFVSAAEQRAQVCVVLNHDGDVRQVILPFTAEAAAALCARHVQQGGKALQGTLRLSKERLELLKEGEKEFHPFPLAQVLIDAETVLSASLISDSLDTAKNPGELLFYLDTAVQGISLKGIVPYNMFEMGRVKVKSIFAQDPEEPPFWVYTVQYGLDEAATHLPGETFLGEGVLLAHRFRDSGVLLGDSGYLTYQAATASGVQEQRLPIYVAGFYDAGVMPIGNKLVLANSSVTSLIHSAAGYEPQKGEEGFAIWCDNPAHAEQVKEQLLAEMEKEGIDRYWHLETFKEYDFARSLVQQFQSDKMLLTLIAVVIIIAACSNIISMLIILVNDKKKEIGILASMGATPKSIALIFGVCGLLMGMAGSALGVGAALLTLHNLQSLVDLLSMLQGREVFQEAFYGSALPNAISYSALWLVVGATVVLSLLAGLVPAIKAALMRPSAILRAEE